MDCRDPKKTRTTQLIYSIRQGSCLANIPCPWKKGKPSSTNNFNVDIQEIAYALDSSTIDLCLSMFLWAKFRKSKEAIKMHALMDLLGSIPTFVEITDGKHYDVKTLDLIQNEPGAIYVMDMAYIDYKRLYDIHQRPAWFVTRAKTNMDYKRVYSRPVDKTTGLRYDQSVRLIGYYISQ